MIQTTYPANIIYCNTLLHSKINNYLNSVRIFQSGQVIKLRNVLVSFIGKKTNSYRIRQISNNWTVMCGADAETLSEIPSNTRQNRPTLPNWRLSCYRYGMICHKSSLISQSRHFERDFDRVLLRLVDILNTQFKYQEGSCHSLLKRWNCWRKSCAKCDSLLLKKYPGRDCMFTLKSEL